MEDISTLKCTAIDELFYYLVKTNGNIYAYFEIVLNGLAFNLQPPLWDI